MLSSPSGKCRSVISRPEGLLHILPLWHHFTHAVFLSFTFYKKSPIAQYHVPNMSMTHYLWRRLFFFKLSNIFFQFWKRYNLLLNFVVRLVFLCHSYYCTTFLRLHQSFNLNINLLGSYKRQPIQSVVNFFLNNFYRYVKTICVYRLTSWQVVELYSLSKP